MQKGGKGGHLAIKHWPEGERPREKLVREGSGLVTEAELLAILLRTGSRGTTALDLARALLVESGSLRVLARMSFHDFMEMRLGQVRSATLAAAFELARRIPT